MLHRDEDASFETSNVTRTEVCLFDSYVKMGTSLPLALNVPSLEVLRYLSVLSHIFAIFNF